MNVADWPLYRYRAHLVSIHDGDTATFTVDLGLRISRTLTVRLDGINAPEITGTTKPAGLDARDHLASLLAGAEWVYVLTDRDGKSFDRWVAKLYVAGPNGDLTDIGQRMIDDGYAVAWP